MEYMILVAFAAAVFITISLKRVSNLRINALEDKVDKLTDKVAVLSLSKSKTDDKVDELYKRLRSLTVDVDGNVELVNELVLDLEKLEEYMEDRKALDKREERMLSGINNIMNYDIGVAREAVRNLEENED